MLLAISDSINWIDCIFQGLYGFGLGIRLFFETVFSSPYLTILFALGMVRIFTHSNKYYR